ncbi:MAG: cytochrome P450 [Anaerolineales bacterium]|nr:cytochrome P450 [Anaerolineales bacterium]
MRASHPPIPPGHWLLGHLPGYQADQLSYEKHLARTYGDVVHVRWANQHAYLVSHPEDVRRVLVDEADKFDKAPIYRELLSYFLGNGLLTSDGDFWRRQRKLAQPAFHHKRILAYAQVMADYTRRQMAAWQPGQVRAINQDMMRLTLSIVAKTLFDADIEAEAGRVGEALTAVLEITNHRIQSPLQIIPDWLPTPENRKRKAAVELLTALVMKIINERRGDGVDRGDLLSMLLRAQDDAGQPMTDRQLRDEAVTIVLAGHETTANALTWAWYLLAQHPEVEAKLHAELARQLGDRQPAPDDLRGLEYAEMVIKEVMRLYPPIPSIARQAKTEVALTEYTVPAGMIVTISPHILHADPRWFPDPGVFRPERFAKANEAALPKYAYLPFSAGPRVCIGNGFALLEATLILAAIAQQYRLELEPGQTVRAHAALTLRPAADLRMRVTPRRPAAPGAGG